MGEKKFRQILNLPDSIKVFRTCVQIFKDHFANNTNSCLMVHGIPTIEDVLISRNGKKYLRNQETSRRFRIYRKFAARHFSDEQFYFVENQRLNSLYIFPMTLEYNKTKHDVENTLAGLFPTCYERCCLPDSELNPN